MSAMMMSVISLKRLRRILLDEDPESCLADLRVPLLASMEIIRTEEHFFRQKNKRTDNNRQSNRLTIFRQKNKRK